MPELLKKRKGKETKNQVSKISKLLKLILETILDGLSWRSNRKLMGFATAYHQSADVKFTSFGGLMWLDMAVQSLW